MLIRQAGGRCDVWTCDLLPARGASDKHLQCDVWEAIHSRQWDFGLFHPMCTFLTTSAAWAFKDPDYDKYPGVGYHQRVKNGTLVGAERRLAREDALANFRNLLALPFPVACENPDGSFINRAIRRSDQCIHPHFFGDDASKATGLWLTKGTPLIESSNNDYVQPRIVNGLPRWGNQTDSGQNKLSPSDDRWLERSATYPGIARALGDQWGRWLA
jgi:hypothetical protein